MAPKKITARFVAYYRVSTDSQGAQGIGLKAQQAAVGRFIKHGADLVGEFTEVESGKRSYRPALAKALEACRRQKAKLLVAKLDRLSRNLAFIASLRESGIDFVAADDEHANKVVLRILAVMAKHERDRVAKHTRMP